MAASFTSEEQNQLLQMIEMFEVIVQAKPRDCESLEILKESYFQLGRKADVLRTSKRIAEACVQLGQLSSAILEYENILEQSPADPDARAALNELENRARGYVPVSPVNEPAAPSNDVATEPAKSVAQTESSRPAEADIGQKAMRSLFVDEKHITAADFDAHWNSPNPTEASKQVSEPFIQLLADKQIVPLEKSLKLLCDKTRLGFLPLEKYDVDIDLARSFPREVCLRWCVLPLDRMSKSILVATANPFNKQAIADLEKACSHMPSKPRFLFYIASPTELMKILRKLFR